MALPVAVEVVIERRFLELEEEARSLVLRNISVELERMGLRSKLHSIDLLEDRLFGLYAKVTLEMPASNAVKAWFTLARLSKRIKLWIAVEWIGEDDVSKEGLLDAAANIMVESGFGSKATVPFDAVELVRESRE